MKERLKQWRWPVRLYLVALCKWLLMAVVTGMICGLVGTAFHMGVDQANALRMNHPWLLLCLPAAGVAIVGYYKLMQTEGKGTNAVIDQVQQGNGLPIALIPSIFIGTVLTHMCGGSSGREGAALQMGGTVGYQVGAMFHMDDRDLRTATMAGMAGFFAALFGTPLTATVFALMVISVGAVYHVAFIPSLVSSLTAYGVSLYLGVEPTRFAVTAPDLEMLILLQVAVLAVLCAMVSILFCSGMHLAEHLMKKYLPNPWIRAAAGGAILIVLTVLLGTDDYSGAGMGIIARAVEEGTARPEAFLLKLLFTAVTLSAGFKGGEVVPSFFVGATFGAVVGPILGLPAGFAAAVGLVSVFCGAVNCPIASIFLALELFGDGGMLYFALACGISDMLSGYTGLYSSQRILYSKLKAQYINVHTNGHTEGHPTEPSKEPTE